MSVESTALCAPWRCWSPVAQRHVVPPRDRIGRLSPASWAEAPQTPRLVSLAALPAVLPAVLPAALPAAASFALGAAAGLSFAKLRRWKRKDMDVMGPSLGHHLAFIARGSETLDPKAQAASAKIRKAVEEGMKDFATSGDFAAVGRGVANLRRALVRRAAEEIREEKVDVEVVAELLVDAVLSRAFRGGEKSFYSELWLLDEGRASVQNIHTEKMAEDLHQPDGNVTINDIVVDERVRGKSATYQPLFVRVQPHLFTRPTFLALLDVFEVFHRRSSSAPSLVGPVPDYTLADFETIQRLLEVVNLTPVMRRARAEVEKYQASGYTDRQWQEHLWHIWFQRHGTAPPKCGFEHVFIGEATEDLNGRELVGGLHNWVKFYLEERRGAARYLGPRYKGTGKHDAALNPYFVSGKFTWDFNGKHLVKDMGGFFVGVSPEWQMAMATVAFFETLDPERATARKWSCDFVSRDVGYVRAARLGDQVYRLCIRRNEQGNLTTFFAGQLGTWDAHARSQLDEVMEPEVLEERLQPMLVLHGFADDSALLRLAARVAAGGGARPRTLRDALRQLHSEIRFRGPQELEHDWPDELPLVAAALVELHDEGRLSGSRWPEVAEALKERTKLQGKKLLLPVRMALTGQRKGHSLSELLELLELMELGAPWSSDILPLSGRMQCLRLWLQEVTAGAKVRSRHEATPPVEVRQ